MNESKFNFLIIIRLIISLLPLLFGFPALAFCLCAYNCAMVIITAGPLYGTVMEVVAAAAAIMLCSAAGYSAQYGGCLAVEIILASVACALCTAYKKPFYAGLMLTSTGFGIGMLLNLKTEADAAGMSIAANETEKVVQLLLDSYGTVDSESKSDAAFGQLLENIGEVLPNVVPAFAVMAALAAGYAVMWQVTKTVRATPLNNGHSFANIRVSPYTVVFGAVMLIMLFIPDDKVSIIGINGLLVFLFIAFCAGLSLIDFLLRRKVKGTFARTVLHGGIFITASFVGAFVPFFNIFVIYALAGIVDCFASFREKVSLENENE